MKYKLLPTTTDLSTLVRTEPKAQPKVFPSTKNCFDEEFATIDPLLLPDYEYNEWTHAHDVIENIWAEGWRHHGPYHAYPDHPDYYDFGEGCSSAGPICTGITELYSNYDWHGDQFGHFNPGEALWAKQVGMELAYKEDRNDEALVRGHAYEDSIAHMFEYKFKKDHADKDGVFRGNFKIVRDCKFYASQEVRGAFCDPDDECIIDGVRGGLEYKTAVFGTHAYNLLKENIVPADYLLQCYAEMWIKNLPFMYIVAGLGYQDLRYFYIERDFEIESPIKNAYATFLDCCRTKTPPVFENGNAEALLKYIIMRRGGQTVKESKPLELGTEWLEQTTLLSTLIQQRELIEKNLEELDEDIANALIPFHNVCHEAGDADYIEIPLPDEDEPGVPKAKITISLRKKEAAPRISVSYDKVAAGLGKEIADRYVTTGFDSTKFRKDFPERKHDFDAEGKPENVKSSDTLKSMAKYVDIGYRELTDKQIEAYRKAVEKEQKGASA